MKRELILILRMELRRVVMMRVRRRSCLMRLGPLEPAVDRANTSSSSRGSIVGSTI